MPVSIQRGETALHIACRRRQITIVRLLLRNGAAVDAKTQVRIVLVRLEFVRCGFLCEQRHALSIL